MNKRIIKLAVPNIISNITVPLVGMVDLAVLGHLDSELYIGAIAIGGVIFNILYWGFGFLRMGTSGFTAQAYGQRNLTELTGIFSRALLVALAGGFLILLFKNPIGWLSFRMINGSEAVEQLALSYYNIRIFAAPATIAQFAFAGWFVGMQNTRFPMIIAIFVNILNLGFNLLFIYGFGMNSDGVALGTLIAQYMGLALSVFLFVRYYGKLMKHWTVSTMNQLKAYHSFFLVNKDIFIRTLCLIFVFTFFTSQSAATDDIVLAVNTLLLQFFMLFSFFADGFAHAGEALVGRYVGSKNPAAMRKVIRLLFLWGLYITIPFTLLYGLFSEQILLILTDNRDIIRASKPYLIWILFIPITGYPSFIWDGIYIGATASVGMRNTMILATLAVFVPAFFLFREGLGNHALWLALILFLAARGIGQTIAAGRYVYSKVP